MAHKTLRVAAGGGGVVLAAGIGLVTNVLTGQWSWGLGVTLVVLVIAAVVVQVWVGGGDESKRVVASGAGAVGVGGSVRGGVRTDVVGWPGSQQVVPEPGDGVIAAGPGAAAIGGDIGEGGVEARFRCAETDGPA